MLMMDMNEDILWHGKHHHSLFFCVLYVISPQRVHIMLSSYHQSAAVDTMMIMFNLFCLPLQMLCSSFHDSFNIFWLYKYLLSLRHDKCQDINESFKTLPVKGFCSLSCSLDSITVCVRQRLNVDLISDTHFMEQRRS